MVIVCILSALLLYCQLEKKNLESFSILKKNPNKYQKACIPQLQKNPVFCNHATYWDHSFLRYQWSKAEHKQALGAILSLDSLPLYLPTATGENDVPEFCLLI